jgi:type IV pilus assembly protein PilN
MVRINLLPVRETLRKRELKYFIIFTATVLVLVASGIGLSYIYLTDQIADRRAERKSHTVKLNNLKKKNQSINKLKTEITRLERQVKTINKLTKVRDTPAPFMAAVSVAIPDEVWLKTIQKSGRNFSVSGEGVDNTVIVQFVRNLQSVRKKFTRDKWKLTSEYKKEGPFFRSVRLVNTSLSKGGVKFKIVGSLR